MKVLSLLCLVIYKKNKNKLRNNNSCKTEKRVFDKDEAVKIFLFKSRQDGDKETRLIFR